MWFRFVAALSVIAMLGFVWMLVFGKGPQQEPPAATATPGTVQTK